MTIKVYIAGVDRTNCVAALSAEFGDSLDGLGPLRCIMRQSEVAYVPAVGSSLKLSDGGSPETIYWDGQIFRVTRRFAPESIDLVEFDVEGQPYAQILARRFIWKDRENKTLYDIVSWINTNVLANEGVSLAGVANPGPTITERLTWFLVPISRAFDDLAAMTGYHWRLASNKTLYFSQFSATAAPFDITDTTGEWDPRTLEIEEDDAEYANRVHEISALAFSGTAGSTGTSEDSEDAITAFAGQTSFPTKAIVRELLEVSVNGVPKTFVNVQEGATVPQTYDFYVIVGGYGVFATIGTWPGSGTWGPAQAGDIIRFRYRAGWSIYPDSGGAGTDERNAGTPGVQVITVDDAAAQTARAAIDGGSGIYEAREEQRVVTSAATLKAMGEGFLRRYAIAIKKCRVLTRKDDSLLAPGQRILFNIAAHSINQQVFIERCGYRWLIDAGGSTLETTISCSSNEPFGKHAGVMDHTIDAARIGIEGSGGGAGTGNIGLKIIQEQPKGIVNGSNTGFKLTYYPVPLLIWLKAGGRPMYPFSDYSLSGADITYTSGSQPKAGEDHWVWYFHNGARRATNARKASGGTDTIDWGHSDIFKIQGDWSFGIWVKFPSDAKGTIVGYGYSHDAPGVIAKYYPYFLGVVGASAAWDINYIHDETTTDEEHRYDTNIPNDAWRYLGVSRNATAKTVSLWVGDGNILTLIEIWTYSQAVHPDSGSDAACRLWVANIAGTATENTLRGIGPGKMTIQEHYMWNAYLTEAQHRLAMKGDPPLSNLQLACPIVGSSPEVDTSPNAFNGIVTGTTVVAGH